MTQDQRGRDRGGDADLGRARPAGQQEAGAEREDQQQCH